MLVFVEFSRFKSSQFIRCIRLFPFFLPFAPSFFSLFSFVVVAMYASTISSPAVSSSSRDGHRVLLWTTYPSTIDIWMNDVSCGCGWRAISRQCMIVVSTGIAIQGLASQLNVGTTAAAEVRACCNVYMNQRIRISSGVTRSWITSRGFGQSKKLITRSGTRHFRQGLLMSLGFPASMNSCTSSPTNHIERKTRISSFGIGLVRIESICLAGKMSNSSPCLQQCALSII